MWSVKKCKNVICLPTEHQGVSLENRNTRRKTSRSRVENQQQTQPTYDAGSGNRTRDTLVGGERSHHCAIPALYRLYLQ